MKSHSLQLHIFFGVTSLVIRAFVWEMNPLFGVKQYRYEKDGNSWGKKKRKKKVSQQYIVSLETSFF